MGSCRTLSDEFLCQRAEQCLSRSGAGRCEPDGHCSLPDPDCPSGHRYVEAAGARSGRCVGQGGDGGGPAPRGFFPAGAIWYADHSKAAVHPASAAMIAAATAAGGWGGGRLLVSFNMHILEADAATKPEPFIKTSDWFAPDCDDAPVPLPAGGAVEGETSYRCLGDGNCTLLVASRSSGKLYEMWRANRVAEIVYGGCLAVWDMNRIYGPNGRGAGCTSANAAGTPIAPLLFSADEVKAGVIDHALHLVLPGSRIRPGVYVYPATHVTKSASGGPDAFPLGAHLRLRSNTDTSQLGTGARVVAQALMKHGMFLVSAGTVALSAQSDLFTKHKWAGLLDAEALSSLSLTDFEVIDHGPAVPYPDQCTREP